MFLIVAFGVMLHGVFLVVSKDVLLFPRPVPTFPLTFFSIFRRIISAFNDLHVSGICFISSASRRIVLRVGEESALLSSSWFFLFFFFLRRGFTRVQNRMQILCRHPSDNPEQIASIGGMEFCTVSDSQPKYRDCIVNTCVL